VPNGNFTIQGREVVTYSPFSAEIISPRFAQIINAAGGTINLTWKGSVVSPDIITNYDVYLGTTNSPVKIGSAITDSFLNNVAIASNTTYLWEVVTRDIYGNTSDSGLYQFKIN
jgi:hypothetical protein